jgi:hypothetical protein
MHKVTKSTYSKRIFVVLSVLCAIFLVCGMAYAEFGNGDDRSLAGQSVMRTAMPPLVAGEYGTDKDNENNALTGVADGDMDYYMFNDDSKHPIEFNIFINNINPSARSATLRMNVYDVDTNTTPGNPEIDRVYVNGKYIGTLNGANNAWGVNIFNLPIGTLKQGKNLVKIMVDQGNIGKGWWAVTIDWAIIKVSSSTTTEISRAWFAPVTVTRGTYINAFAEVSNPTKAVTKVQVYMGTTLLFTLTDPDKDNTWSGQYKIPTTWLAGWKGNLTIVAKNASNVILARWPGLSVK